MNKIIKEFLKRIKNTKTRAAYRGGITRFTKSVKVPLCELREYHLTDLLDQIENPNYRRIVARSVKRLFKWAARNKFIEESPFTDVKLPREESRGDEVYIEPSEWQAILAKVKSKDTLNILTVMHDTGCRPQEARAIEARHLHGSMVIFPKVESKGKERSRVIRLPNRVRELLEGMAVRYPKGPLLRRKGNPWSAQALCNRCKKLGFKPYAIRHTFATDKLKAGVDLLTVATYLGHKNINTLLRVYEHIRRCDDYLQETLERTTA
jgi:integrase